MQIHSKDDISIIKKEQTICEGFSKKKQGKIGGNINVNFSSAPAGC